MNLWRLLFGGSEVDESTMPIPTGPAVNPATGLPMMDDIGSIDVAGNPFDMDLHGSDISSPETGIGDNDWL